MWRDVGQRLQHDSKRVILAGHNDTHIDKTNVQCEVSQVIGIRKFY